MTVNHFAFYRASPSKSVLVQTIEDVPQPPSGRIMIIEEPIRSCSSLQGGERVPGIHCLYIYLLQLLLVHY